MKTSAEVAKVIRLRVLLRQARAALTKEYRVTDQEYLVLDEVYSDVAKLVEEIDDELAKE